MSGCGFCCQEKEPLDRHLSGRHYTGRVCRNEEEYPSFGNNHMIYSVNLACFGEDIRIFASFAIIKFEVEAN
jgi:hypothetical protein